MAEITITEILDDLRAADETTRRFERRYWLSSADFYQLYQQGALDDGTHMEDFAMWAGFYRIKLDREAALKAISQERLQKLKAQAKGQPISLEPGEPAISASD